MRNLSFVLEVISSPTLLSKLISPLRSFAMAGTALISSPNVSHTNLLYCILFLLQETPGRQYVMSFILGAHGYRVGLSGVLLND